MAFFAKKTWKDRRAEFINRRTLTKEDGSEEVVTVARNEGNISEEGDAFNSDTMNDLEERVEAGFNGVNESLTTTNKNVTSVKSIADSAVKTAASNLTFSSPTVFTAQGAAPCSIAGKMGAVYTVFTVNSVIKAGDVIAAIPSGYRPKVDYKNIPILKCGDYTNVYTVNLLTTGIITAAKDMPIGIYQLGLSYAAS